jgi:Effector-associated domain 1
MGMNDDRLDQILIDELARVLPDMGLATVIAQRSGLPPGGTPSVHLPLEFWHRVVQDAQNGKVSGGAGAVAEAAAQQFPGNEIFRLYVRKDEETSWGIIAPMTDEDTIVRAFRVATNDPSVRSTHASLVLDVQLRVLGRTALLLEHRNREGKLAHDLRATFPKASKGSKIGLLISSAVAFASTLSLFIILLQKPQATHATSENDTQDKSANAFPTTSTDLRTDQSQEASIDTEEDDEPKDNLNEFATETSLPVAAIEPTPPSPKKKLTSSCPPRKQLTMKVTYKKGEHKAFVRLEPPNERLQYAVKVEAQGPASIVPIDGSHGVIPLGGAGNHGTFTLTGVVTGDCEMLDSEPHDIEVPKSK